MRPVRLISSRQFAQLARPSVFLPVAAEAPVSQHIRAFSVLNRPPPQYEGHVPLTLIEKGAMTLGSAIGAFIDPRRAGKHSGSVQLHLRTSP